MTKDTKILSEEIKSSTVKQRDLAFAVGIAPEHLNAVLNGRLKMTENLYKRITYWYEKIKEQEEIGK